MLSLLNHWCVFSEFQVINKQMICTHINVHTLILLLTRIRFRCIWGLKTKFQLWNLFHLAPQPTFAPALMAQNNLTTQSNRKGNNSVPFSQGKHSVSNTGYTASWVNVNWNWKSEKATKKCPFQVSVFWIKKRPNKNGSRKIKDQELAISHRGKIGREGQQEEWHRWLRP